MKDDATQKKIFARNLNYYVNQSGKQQKEIAKLMGFSEKTFNGWCRGLSIPTMGKVQLIADFFGIGKTDLLEDKKPSEMIDLKMKEIMRNYDLLNEEGRDELLKQSHLLVKCGEYNRIKGSEADFA